MKIGIIGAGFIARAVATTAIRAGHEVMVSNTRTPDTLFSLTGTIGCKAGTPHDAAAFGDIVLLAIPLKNYSSIPVQALVGKVVLDANNYYPERDGHIVELDQGSITTSELVAQHLPQSKLVKVFNAIAAGDIDKEGKLADSSQRRALPLAGDDPAAKRIVADLLGQFGFDTVDAGLLAEGWRFEKDTPAYCVPFDATQLRAALGAAQR